MSDKPKALFIDDNPEDLLNALRPAWPDKLEDLEVLDPSEVVPSHFENVDACFVDFDLSEWHSRLDEEEGTSSCIATRPKDGHALIAVLRSYIDKNHTATAFCMLTNRLGKVADGIPNQRTPYTASRAHGYDWVLDKDEKRVLERIESVTDASNSLKYISKDNIRSVFDWLEPSRTESGQHFESTELAIERCRPPVHDFLEPAHSLVVLRWLLHRVLPYPSFLIGTNVLAARLGVKPQLLPELEEKWSELNACRYNGPGNMLFECRWWRPAVERLLRATTNGQSLNPTAVWEAIQKNCSIEFSEGSKIEEAVPTLDPITLQFSDVKERSDCIEVRPDDWPEFADAPWMLTSDAKDHEYLVNIDDRHLLEN